MVRSDHAEYREARAFQGYKILWILKIFLQMKIFVEKISRS